MIAYGLWRSVFVAKSKGMLLLADVLINSASGWSVCSVLLIFLRLSDRSNKSTFESSQPVIVLARLMTLFILELDLHSVLPPQAIIQNDTMLCIIELYKR